MKSEETIEEQWQSLQESWKETWSTGLGKKFRKHKELISTDTWTRITERKNSKHKINQAQGIEEKHLLQAPYLEKDREIFIPPPTELLDNTKLPSRAEIATTIKFLKSGKTGGPNDRPPEALKKPTYRPQLTCCSHFYAKSDLGTGDYRLVEETIEEQWQSLQESWKETWSTGLGKKFRKHKELISTDTWTRITERKNSKHKINQAQGIEEKHLLQAPYLEKDREIFIPPPTELLDNTKLPSRAEIATTIKFLKSGKTGGPNDRPPEALKKPTYRPQLTCCSHFYAKSDLGTGVSSRRLEERTPCKAAQERGPVILR
ncbi:hypothetical protein EGW08_021658 [Elysia chlorotica]|uniref:Uncharacterized protein n=1 Tax=Elysia chlorotica TaxID=188477 RepID=A0A433SMY2_ELYCH|nr:hypothetical protein EGW08_021658 [Elysia chlorotica]